MDNAQTQANGGHVNGGSQFTTNFHLPQTRANRLADFDENPMVYVRDAEQNEGPVAASLARNTEAAATTELPNMVHAYLDSKGLRMKSNGRDPSSKLEDFNTSAKMVGLHACLRDNFDYHFFVSAEQEEQVRQASQVGDLGQGDPERPWRTLSLRQASLVRLPRFGIDNVFARTETQPEDLTRVPQYNVPSTDELMEDLGEVDDIPTSGLTFDQLTAGTRKVGRGLKTARKWRGNPVRAEAVMLWVARVGVRYQIGVRDLGIKLIADGITTNNIAATGYTARSLRNMAAYFSPADVYESNSIVGDKATMLQFAGIDRTALAVAANTESGGEPAVNMVVSTAQLFNDLSPNGAAAIVEDNMFLASTADRVLAWDSDSTAVLTLLSGGQIDESAYDPSAQIDVRYLTREFGMYIEETNSRVMHQLA